VYLCFYNWSVMCLLRGTSCRSCIFCGSENKAIISLYSIKWLVFITVNECVYFAVRSVHTVHFWVFITEAVWLLRGRFCRNIVFMSDYFTVQHCLVFLTENECVYCALRCAHTEYLCFVWIWEQRAIIHCKELSDCFYNRERVCLLRGTFCTHSVFVSL
jgi:hypothetical protein